MMLTLSAVHHLTDPRPGRQRKSVATLRRWQEQADKGNCGAETSATLGHGDQPWTRGMYAMKEMGTCSDCSYWEPSADPHARHGTIIDTPKTGSERPSEGRCRRYPPNRSKRLDDPVMPGPATDWARTLYLDWCGEWAPRASSLEADLGIVLEDAHTMSDEAFLAALDSLASADRGRLFQAVFSEEERCGLLHLADKPFYALYRQRVAAHFAFGSDERSGGSDASGTPHTGDKAADADAATQSDDGHSGWQSLLASASVARIDSLDGRLRRN